MVVHRGISVLFTWIKCQCVIIETFLLKTRDYKSSSSASVVSCVVADYVTVQVQNLRTLNMTAFIFGDNHKLMKKEASHSSKTSITGASPVIILKQKSQCIICHKIRDYKSVSC